MGRGSSQNADSSTCRAAQRHFRALIAEKNVELFLLKHGIYTKEELFSRYEIKEENHQDHQHRGKDDAFDDEEDLPAIRPLLLQGAG